MKFLGKTWGFRGWWKRSSLGSPLVRRGVGGLDPAYFWLALTWERNQSRAGIQVFDTCFDGMSKRSLPSQQVQAGEKFHFHAHMRHSGLADELKDTEGTDIPTKQTSLEPEKHFCVTVNKIIMHVTRLTFLLGSNKIDQWQYWNHNYKFYKSVLSTYNVPGVILGTGDIETMRHTLSSQGVTNILWERGR